MGVRAIGAVVDRSAGEVVLLVWMLSGVDLDPAAIRTRQCELSIADTDSIRLAATQLEIIGAYTLHAFVTDPEPIAAYRSRGPIERELLDAIAAGDDASRVVYADWLESIGDAARAELLRLQHTIDAMAPDAPGFERATDRLRELAAGVDPGWRSRVATRPIEGCPGFEFACPKQWSALEPTGRDGVRHCGSCKQQVYYCASVEDARDHAGRGECVALDITSPRWANDLAPPFELYVCEVCAIDVGIGLDRCPRCGGDVTGPRATMRGRMVIQ